MKSQRGDRDRETYEDPQVVARYGRTRELQLPEQTLLEELGPALARMDMLDLGVGGGRTAWFFAPRVKTYLGLDYAPAMVEQCNQNLPAYKFVVGDACHLDFAADNSYDFVLFSYNGIDHLELPDRERALIEMKRVLRPGGIMAFSSHNANYIRPDQQAAALARLGMEDIGCAMNDTPLFLDGSDPRVTAFNSPWVYYRCRKPGQAG